MSVKATVVNVTAFGEQINCYMSNMLTRVLISALPVKAGFANQLADFLSLTGKVSGHPWALT